MKFLFDTVVVLTLKWNQTLHFSWFCERSITLPIFIFNYRWRSLKNETWNFILKVMSLSNLHFFLSLSCSDFTVLLSAITRKSRVLWQPSRQCMPFRPSRTTPLKQSQGTARGLARSRHSLSIHCFQWSNVNISPAMLTPSLLSENLQRVFFQVWIIHPAFQIFQRSHLGWTSSSPFM